MGRVRVRFERAVGGESGALPSTLDGLSFRKDFQKRLVPAVYWLTGLGGGKFCAALGIAESAFGGHGLGVAACVLEEAASERGLRPLSASVARSLTPPLEPRWAWTLLRSAEEGGARDPHSASAAASVLAELDAAWLRDAEESDGVGVAKSELVRVVHEWRARRAVLRRRAMALHQLMCKSQDGLLLSADLTGVKATSKTDMLLCPQGIASNKFVLARGQPRYLLYFLLQRVALACPEAVGEPAAAASVLGGGGGNGQLRGLGLVRVVPSAGRVYGFRATGGRLRAAWEAMGGVRAFAPPSGVAAEEALSAAWVSCAVDAARHELGWPWEDVWKHLELPKKNTLPLYARSISVHEKATAAWRFVVSLLATAHGLGVREAERAALSFGAVGSEPVTFEVPRRVSRWRGLVREAASTFDLSAAEARRDVPCGEAAARAQRRMLHLAAEMLWTDAQTVSVSFGLGKHVLRNPFSEAIGKRHLFGASYRRAWLITQHLRELLEERLGLRLDD